MNSYAYQSLDSSSSEIRLLELAPGSWDEDIKFQLRHACLSERPAYEALSYTWGNACNRTSVALSGHRFEITANLESALRHLRDRESTRTLWVDALCINQNDPPERTHQVLKMRDIFVSADMVLAWVGESVEGIAEAFTLMEDLSEFMEKTFHERRRNIMLQEAVSPHFLERNGFDIWSKHWHSLYEFLDRDYWRRIWVIQELAVPRSKGEEGCHEVVMIGCGSSWLPSRTFEKACFCLMGIHNFTALSLTSEERQNCLITNGMPLALIMVSVIRQLDPVVDHVFRDITSLLSITRNFQTTDPRDKVYALLGIARQEDRVVIPDYSKTTDRLRRELVKHQVEVDNSLRCLAGNRLGPDDQRFQYPSWGADMSGLHLPSTQAEIWYPSQVDHAASGDSRPEVSFSADLDYLTVKGLLVDTIEKVYIPLPPIICDEGLTRGPVAFLKGMRQISKLYSSLNAVRKNDLWRAMVMDRDAYDITGPVTPAPERLHHRFEVLLGLAQPPHDFEPSLPLKSRRMAYLAPLIHNLKISLFNRSVFVTTIGRIGISPLATKTGDMACILFGGYSCYVLREENGERCVLIGDAYVHGVMNGELMREGASEARDFVLR